MVSNPSAVTAAGVYRLIATNSFGCVDTAFVTIINNPQQCIIPLPQQININPCNNPNINPCNPPVRDILSVLVVRNTAVKVEVEIVIYNSTGQIMFSMNSNQSSVMKTYSIPMKNMAVGIYVVSVRVNDEKRVVKRIMRGE